MGNKEITKTILEQLDALLEPEGFKKKGLTFFQDHGDVVHLIGMQKSLGSTDREIKVTTNLGVWIRALAPIRAGKPDPPRLSDAHWRQRIGTLLPERTDKWWSADSPANAKTVSISIVEALSKYGLPALHNLGTTDALIQLWHTGACPGLTAFQRDKYLQQLRNVKAQV